MIKKCEKCDNLGDNQSFTNISSFPKKILKRFVSFGSSLIFTYCLFVGKNTNKLVIFPKVRTLSEAAKV